MTNAFSQNRELLLDERILGIATLPRRRRCLFECGCGVGIPLMYVSCRMGREGAGGGGPTAHPDNIYVIWIMNFF